MKTRNIHSRPEEPSITSYRELSLSSKTHNLRGRNLPLPNINLDFSRSAIVHHVPITNFKFHFDGHIYILASEFCLRFRLRFFPLQKRLSRLY